MQTVKIIVEIMEYVFIICMAIMDTCLLAWIVLWKQIKSGCYKDQAGNEKLTRDKTPADKQLHGSSRNSSWTVNWNDAIPK